MMINRGNQISRGRFFHSGGANGKAVIVEGPEFDFFVSDDGSGVGTKNDPWGSDELIAANIGGEIPMGSSIGFKRGDTFNAD